jgi:hypothetical protein
LGIDSATEQRWDGDQSAASGDGIYESGSQRRQEEQGILPAFKQWALLSTRERSNSKPKALLRAIPP